MNSQSHSYTGEAGAASPAPQSPIGAEMIRLREGTEEVHNLLDRLEERLSQVLRQIPPHPVGDEPGKTLHESALHGALMGQATDVVRVNSRIVSMLDRLTL
ncbi:hypothetical protein [Luteimonas saliphila]|uniref:hypothetical protein n=1 Tax=Luteimonas saliphila TaxID=2804919 RepID=UPI00192DCD30|nr:hypothetical protein [Luteimonas saliphila]